MDVKKAFNSVSHHWIIRTLEMHGIHNSLIHLVKSAMKTWRITLKVNTSNGKENIGSIKVNRGILQGDSFCVRLFPLALNPIAWYLKSTEGYTFSDAPNHKFTHLLFVDDLKSYHKSKQKAAVVLSKLKMKAVEITPYPPMMMPAYHSGYQDHYTFLDKLQNTQHLDDKVTKEAAEEYEKRIWVI